MIRRLRTPNSEWLRGNLEIYQITYQSIAEAWLWEPLGFSARMMSQDSISWPWLCLLVCSLQSQRSPPCGDEVATAAQASGPFQLSPYRKESSLLAAELESPWPWLASLWSGGCPWANQRMSSNCSFPDGRPFPRLRAMSTPPESFGLTGKEWISEHKPCAVLAFYCPWAYPFKLLAQKAEFPSRVIFAFCFWWW